MVTVTQELLQAYKEEYINLLLSIKRKDADINGLLNFLENIKFYEAPATTQFACSFEGGLLIHSLNVYKNLLKMIPIFTEDAETRESPKFMTWLNNLYNLDEDDFSQKLIEADPADEYVINFIKDNKETLLSIKETLIIIGLLHDISKVDTYEKYVKNEKVYYENGSKKDELGAFDWSSTIAYKYTDPNKRVCIGPKGFDSFYSISQFLPLTYAEVAALVNQFSDTDKNSTENLASVLSSYKLVSVLHSADLIATYITDTYYVKE